MLGVVNAVFVGDLVEHSLENVDNSWLSSVVTSRNFTLELGEFNAAAHQVSDEHFQGAVAVPVFLAIGDQAAQVLLS